MLREIVWSFCFVQVSSFQRLGGEYPLVTSQRVLVYKGTGPLQEIVLQQPPSSLLALPASPRDGRDEKPTRSGSFRFEKRKTKVMIAFVEVLQWFIHEKRRVEERIEELCIFEKLRVSSWLCIVH